MAVPPCWDSIALLSEAISFIYQRRSKTFKRPLAFTSRTIISCGFISQNEHGNTARAGAPDQVGRPDQGLRLSRRLRRSVGAQPGDCQLSLLGSKSSTWGANVCGGVADQAGSGSSPNFSRQA
jgi:hypothetical protein